MMSLARLFRELAPGSDPLDPPLFGEGDAWRAGIILAGAVLVGVLLVAVAVAMP